MSGTIRPDLYVLLYNDEFKLLYNDDGPKTFI